MDVAYKGNWLGYNRSIHFKIRQLFWKSWWFISLLVLVVASVGYAFYSYRKQQKKKQERIRMKIASDLHDDIGSTLSSISIISDLLQARHVEDESNPNTRVMIRKIGSDAQNMLESMDDIIWSVISANDEYRNLILRIREYAIPLFELKEISFKITDPESVASYSIPMEIRRNVFLIVKEAVNNLVKYSECNHAVIDFSLSHTILRVVVEDNGKGFDTSIDYGRNGLENMKDRAGKIGGKLTIRSLPGKGTAITLTVKI